MKVLVALAYVLAVAVGGGGAVWFGWAAAHARREEIGRASCRERV